MIQERDAEQVGPLPESAGEDAILWAGRHIAAGGVIVRTNPGSGVHQDQRLEHLAWMHDGQRQGADRDDVDADDGMLGIEPADQELFAVQSRKERSEDGRSGDRGGQRRRGRTARLSRTSVTRYRGTAYSLLGFGCRIIFRMLCEP